MTEETKYEPIKKVSIVISKGSLDGIYPGLIMANGARMEGIEAMVFFTFFGLETIIKKRMNKIKVATVGNPGMHIPTIIGAIPGMSSFATTMMKKEMDKLDIPPVDEFIEMLSAAGAKLYACKAAMDMFHYKKEDLIDEVEAILTVGEFYELSAGAQIIFT
ncbi:MAG: DsrE/DsrF/DrsH-like family protein [Candidatus Latescibacteria bacterium]|nr:DsrE/DsrF/DrsH-like family protein [Candidatus Latescibacterota bacterium]